MLKQIKMYTNKRNGDIITEREFAKLPKEERKDYKAEARLNHANYRN
jgi:hypothetical protein